MLTKVMYKKARANLSKWDEAYHSDNAPLVTDSEYDNLHTQVKEYADKHNITLTRVGTKPKALLRVTHPNRMGSQQDIFTDEQALAWVTNITDNYGPQELVAYPKYDGLSLKLIYKDGVLLSAATRGDGNEGEDVTDNAIVIDTIPNTIPTQGTVEINGEIVIYKDDFEALNTTRRKTDKPEFANARNAAAGSLRLLDTTEVAKRKLTFVPWELVGSSSELTATDRLLTELGFIPHPLAIPCSGYEAMVSARSEFINVRSQLPVGLDGIVFKINDITQHSIIGETNRHPKWSMAWKFVPVEGVTRITSVVTQVGRTGKITPVAIIEPTLIDGSVIRRVTLHNYNEIKIKDIRIGDSVTLIKSGDIIPKITSVFKERRGGSEVVITPPAVCPNCDAAVVTEAIFVRCPNSECSSRAGRVITFFAGRDYMDISGLGPVTVDKLVSSGLVSTPLSLYKLTSKDLSSLPGFTQVSADKLLSSIANTKGEQLHRVIAALGIHKVGRTVSKQLCKLYGAGLLTVSYDELVKLPGIGPEIAKSFTDYVRDNSVDINELMSVIEPSISTDTVGSLQGQVVVLTGTMVGGKSAIKELLESRGATVSSSVNRKTGAVVYGDKAGKKLTKANQLGITTIPYQTVLANINKGILDVLSNVDVT